MEVTCQKHLLSYQLLTRKKKKKKRFKICLLKKIILTEIDVCENLDFLEDKLIVMIGGVMRIQTL